MSPCSEERTQLLGRGHEHSFSYDNDPRPGQRSMCCACGTYLNEHAPGHPFGVQAGPGGMYARWCLVDGCDWRDTTAPQKDAGRIEAGALATFLVCVIGISLFALAVMGGHRVMCATHDKGLSYCAEYQQAHR